MQFLFTPEEAQTTASQVASWLKAQQFEIEVESALGPDAPYRTSLVASKGGFSWLIEAQGTANYNAQLQRLSSWLSARRLHCELYLAAPEDSVLQGKLLKDLKRDGVGLLLVSDDGSIEIAIKSRNPALVVTPDPTLVLGGMRAEVTILVERFNQGDRKDALRDMYELVERETSRLLYRLARKGWINLSEPQIERMTWSDQINVLSSSNQYQSGQSPLLATSDKDDLQSFRGARNLLDHKAKGKRDEFRREQQFTERMIQGPRLTALLLGCQRKVR